MYQVMMTRIYDTKNRQSRGEDSLNGANVRRV